ncbi:MAG: ArnT family glycosyltransferase [Candidatus Nanohalobium sp.]
MILKEQYTRLKDRIEKNPEISAVIGLFMVSQAVMLFTLLNKPPIWDTSIYMAMGKHLYSLGEIGLWEGFRPPLIPVIYGVFWKLGIPAVPAARLVALIISTTGITAFYYGVKDMDGQKTAFYATGLLISTYVFVAKSTMLLTGIPSALILFSSVWMYEKQKYSLSGILLALAFLTRFPAAIAGPVLVAYTFYEGWVDKNLKKPVKQSFKLTAAFFTTILPYLILNQVYSGSFIQPFINAVKVPAAAASKYIFGLYYFIEALKFNPLLALSIPGIYIAWKKKESQYLLSTFLFLSAYGFFTVFPHKEPRYMLLFLPFMAFLAGRTIKELGTQVQNKDYFKWGFIGLTAVIMVIFAFQAYQTNSYVNENTKQFYNHASGLEGVVVSNSPAVAAYGDIKYKGLPPGYLPGIYRNMKGRADYYAINSCAWYCSDSIKNCEKNIRQFTSNLTENYEKSFELKGKHCNYTVYEVGSKLGR